MIPDFSLIVACRTPPPGRWSPPRTCWTACAAAGDRTASRPGSHRATRQVDDQRAPERPAIPRDSTAVGTPWATPYARIASAIPGTWRSTTRAVTSGVRSVGRQPRAARGQDDVVAGADRRAQRRLDRLAVRHDDAGRRRRSPSRAAPPRARAPAVGVHAGRGPVRRRDHQSPHDGSLRRPVARPPARLRRHPDVGDPASLSTALTMSTSARAATDTRSAPPSRRRCGRRSGPWRVMSTPSSATVEVDGDGVHRDRVGQRHEVRRALGRLDARRSGPRPARRPWAPARRAAARRPRGDEQHAARARVASRTVTALADTSTIRACPRSSRCVSRRRGRRSSLDAPPVPQQQAQRARRPASTRVTSSGTTARHAAPARPPTRCEPWPPTGRTTRRPSAPLPSVGRGRTAACPAATSSHAGHRAAPAAAEQRRARPASRSAGRTNTSNDTNELTGLPGSVKIGVPSAPTVPKPCGIPGCIATLSNRTVPRRGQHLLHRVVGAGAHAAAGDDQVGADAAGRSSVCSSARGGRRARCRPGTAPAPGSPRGGGQHVAVAVEDLAVAAARGPAGTSSSRWRAPTTRGAGRTRDPARADGGEQRRSGPGRAAAPALQHDVARRRRPRPPARTCWPALGRRCTIDHRGASPPLGPLDGHDGVGARRHRRAGHDPDRGARARARRGSPARRRRRRPPAAAPARSSLAPATSAARTA